ncbi:hypothetical protein AMS68_004617 [Peltaster fructicola]|uniref:Dihydrodipicolinate synthase n=1 Tax=Peltaster fructicola TaxID=286661 RepID=A0A6H0XXE6_9PEZI|nr:hypothetical protein AMS68_004617 [Peltaster fructicola]
MTAAPASTPPPRGVYVPVPTFFTTIPTSQVLSGRQLDLASQSAHTQFLASGGIRGLVLLGSTGEAIVVSPAQRRELIKSQRECLDSHGFQDRPIIAGTASQGIEETLAAIEISKEAGAAYAMVLAPGFFAATASQHGLEQWYQTIADHAQLPILIYHYPGVSNNLSIAATTFEKLSRHHNIVGAKLSHGMVDDQILIAASPNIDHAHFHTFTGLGQILLPFLSIGGAGTIDGLAGIFPRTVSRLYQLWTEASTSTHGVSATKLTEMRELQYRITRGEKLVAAWGLIGIKEALARLWHIGDAHASCLPLAGGFPNDDDEWRKWSKTFEELKDFEESL